jgi:hypothetical protein
MEAESLGLGLKKEALHGVDTTRGFQFHPIVNTRPHSGVYFLSLSTYNTFMVGMLTPEAVEGNQNGKE